ncbi:stage III sporulation protein AG [Aquibacillus saliphilus]|uniref:stage III sporulation protein AG n=1 Tax=Aquibacillus saliphilus TaxID=1909422 RepID=UPI0034E1BA9A
MGNPFEKLFSHYKLKTEDGKKPTKLGYILIIALIGLLILIVSNLFQSSSKDEPDLSLSSQDEGLSSEEQAAFLNKEDNKTSLVEEIETGYETDLINLLEKVQGISDVDVMVNLDSTNQQVYEKNLIIGTQTTEETDQNGGERYVEDATKEQQVVIVRQGDKEVPLVVQTKKPEVRGVFVVAKGVDHIELEQGVVEAVSRVLNVPSHKISVMPKNKGEE